MTNLMTRQQAAETLGISVVTLDRLRQSGQLAYLQRVPNGKVWITPEALAEYLARISHPARPERPVKATYRRRRT